MIFQNSFRRYLSKKLKDLCGGARKGKPSPSVAAQTDYGGSGERGGPDRQSPSCPLCASRPHNPYTHPGGRWCYLCVTDTDVDTGSQRFSKGPDVQFVNNRTKIQNHTCGAQYHWSSGQCRLSWTGQCKPQGDITLHLSEWLSSKRQETKKKKKKDRRQRVFARMWRKGSLCTAGGNGNQCSPYGHSMGGPHRMNYRMIPQHPSTCSHTYL